MHQRRKWQPTPVLLPGKSHGQRSLVGYSLWGRKESDTTERLHFHFHFHSFTSRMKPRLFSMAFSGSMIHSLAQADLSGASGLPSHLPFSFSPFHSSGVSFFNARKRKVKVKSLSRVRLFVKPWTAAYQGPPSMEFSRQEYWSGVPVPSLKMVLGERRKRL